MKRAITLIVALLLILLITRLEDYLGQISISSLTTDKEQIDYYLADFSVMAVADDGSVSYELAGRHLSHWQAQKQSLIIKPEIFQEGQSMGDQLKVTADEAHINQNSQLAELSGNVHVQKSQPGEKGEVNMQTDYLTYDMQKREISTDALVLVTTPSGSMKSNGLTGTLDDNLLRFNSNVHSIYKVQ